jgi:hypothetical protein
VSYFKFIEFGSLPISSISWMGSLNSLLQAKMDFLNFFGPNTLNFPYISEELTDKDHLRKSIFAGTTFSSIILVYENPYFTFKE